MTWWFWDIPFAVVSFCQVLRRKKTWKNFLLRTDPSLRRNKFLPTLKRTKRQCDLDLQRRLSDFSSKSLSDKEKSMFQTVSNRFKPFQTVSNRFQPFPTTKTLQRAVFFLESRTVLWRNAVWRRSPKRRGIDVRWVGSSKRVLFCVVFWLVAFICNGLVVFCLDFFKMGFLFFRHERKGMV